MSNVTVYTKDNCHYCVMAKKLLEEKGISYSEIVIGRDILREVFVAYYPNVKTVPLIFIDDQKVGSYEDLKEYFDGHSQFLLG